MPRDVPTKKEVHDALERQVQLEKRRQREGRELLATLRHAQAHLLGIDVVTIDTEPQSLGGHSGITHQQQTDRT